MLHSEVTVIVPTLATEHSSKGLKICLESLYKTFDGPVIVTQNGDSKYKWKRDVLSEAWPFLIIEMNKQGQCGAVNEAVKQSETPWVLVVNDDMVFPEGWFEKLTYAVDNFGLLVASPNLVEPQEGAPPFLQKFCGGLGGDYDEKCFMDFAKEHKENEIRLENTVEDGFNLPFLVRKDVFETVGGFDEKYDPWGSNSDSDLQYKFMLAGITPKRVRTSLVYHFSQTSGTFHPDNKEYWDKNWEYFKEKWGFERASAPDIWYKPELPEENKFHPEWEGKYV